MTPRRATSCEKALALFVGADAENRGLLLLVRHAGSFGQQGTIVIDESRDTIDAGFRLRFFGEGLFDAIFERGEGCGVAGGAEARDVGLREVLVTVLQVAGKRDVLDLAGAVDLHQRFGDGFEGAGLASAGIDYGVDWLLADPRAADRRRTC